MNTLRAIGSEDTSPDAPPYELNRGLIGQECDRIDRIRRFKKPRRSWPAQVPSGAVRALEWRNALYRALRKIAFDRLNAIKSALAGARLENIKKRADVRDLMKISEVVALSGDERGGSGGRQMQAFDAEAWICILQALFQQSHKAFRLARRARKSNPQGAPLPSNCVHQKVDLKSAEIPSLKRVAERCAEALDLMMQDI